MERAIRLVTVVLLAAALCATARAETASVLLQEGVYEQEVVGDLDKAMATYEKIIADAEATRRCVAEAHYRLAKCCLAKGQKERAAEQFRQVVERYHDQEAFAGPARRELAALQPTDAPPGEWSFGPEIERVVNDDGVDHSMFIDLDEGRLLTPPEGLSREEGPVLDWCRSAGVDAMCETSASVRGLVCFDMVVHPINTAIWQSDDPRSVTGRELLASGTPGNPVFMSAKGDLPATFAFRTREGGMGVLQIVAFSADPRGVRLRYKMVLRAGEETGLTIVVPDVDSSGKGLDLDAMALVALLKTGSPEANMEAAAAAGADLVCENTALILVNGAEATRTEAISKGGYPLRLLASGSGANVVTTREGGRFLVEEVWRGKDEVGMSVRRLPPVGGPERTPARPDAARLAELSIQLALARSEVVAREAALEEAARPLKVVEAAPETARWLPAPETTERQVRVAKAELDAARKKVEILAQQIARLEGMSGTAPVVGVDCVRTLRRGECLDFETGEVKQAPPVSGVQKITEQGEAVRDWAMTSGVDVGLFLDERDRLRRPEIKPSFIGFGLSFAMPLVRSAWQDATPPVLNALEWFSHEEFRPVRIDMPGGLVQAFRTAGGSLGLLQCLEFNSDPLEARIRYKLLESGPQAVAVPIGPGTDAGGASRMAELRIRIAQVEATLKTKEAEIEVAQKALVGTEALVREGRMDTASLDRSRLDLTRARAELESARQELQILTEELSRVRQEQERGARALDHARRRAGQAAERARILQALRSTGVAVAMYRSDHDGACPPDLDALVKGGYVAKKDALPSGVRPDLQWRLQEPTSGRPDEVVLYHWPPVDGQVALLYQDTAVAWAPVGDDGGLKDPRSGKVITTATQAAPNAASLADLRLRLAEAQAELKAAAIRGVSATDLWRSLEESTAAGQTSQAELDAAKQAATETQARVSAALNRVEQLKKAISLLEGAAGEVATALDVAQRFLELLRSGSDDGELIGLAVPGTSRDPAAFPPKMRQYFDLSGVAIAEFWLADEDACAVTSFFPARDGEHRGALGIGLRKHGNRWLVRDTDALPTEQARRQFVQGFRDAKPSARQVYPTTERSPGQAVPAPDPVKAANMLPMMATAFVSVREATERGDAESALQAMSTFLPRVRDLHRQLVGTPAHGPVGMAIEQLEHVQKALESGNLEQARSILDAFDFSGPQLQKLVEQAGKGGGGRARGNE